MGKLARQAVELGHKWQFLGINTLGDPEAIRLAAGALEGGVFTEPAFSAPKDPKALRFKENYRKRFGEDPEVWAATFYDAIQIIAAALDGQQPTSENLRQNLLRIRDFPGVTGATTFLANGDVIKGVELRQIRDGKSVPIAP
jgi:branched-chain amino acid transport system substrate-binding protein